MRVIDTPDAFARRAVLGGVHVSKHPPHSHRMSALAASALHKALPVLAPSPQIAWVGAPRAHLAPPPPQANEGYRWMPSPREFPESSREASKPRA